MIRINLLPVRQMKQKTQAIRQLVMGGAVLAVTLLVLLAGTGFLFSEVSRLEKKIVELTAEKKEMQKTLDLIDKHAKAKKLVEQQIGIVQKLQKKSQLTVHILDEIARKTPHERMWLTSLTQNAGSLKLTGMALDNRTIASYLDDLKESPYLGNVTLGGSTLSMYGGRNLKQFTLSCSVALPVEEILTTIALFRFINPDAVIRIAGGRQQLRADQYRCFSSGANGAIVGNYLTTAGSSITEDLEALEKMGFTFKRAGGGI
ncbi:MAG: pilus assembly protein PilN [Candidatus Electrothrix sp. AR1]|nr:pilus assembly protein PilN [Candidatus Electrothrix sp. AR1]